MNMNNMPTSMWRRITAGLQSNINLRMQLIFIIGSLIVILQMLFLNNNTIQILPKVFLPNSYTYIDRSSVIYSNNNKLLVLNRDKSNKVYREQLAGKKQSLPKPKKNKSKPIQYVIYKFNRSLKGYKIKTFKHEIILFQYPDEQTSFYNGNMTIHNPNPMSYHSVDGSNIYITSAYARYGAEPENRTWYNISHGELRDYGTNPTTLPNSSMSDTIKFISITGWMAEPLIDKPLHCCLLLKNQSVISYLNPRRMMWYQVRRQPLFAAKSYCPIPLELTPQRPVGASLSLPEYDCYLRMFMQIQYSEIRRRNTLAFCAKIAYGGLPANRLIEWLEIQRYVGVDKVMIYYYNLNNVTMRVLKGYVDEGFVTLQPFDFPQPDDPKRYVGQKAAQPFMDEQVAVYDCIERLKGYNYVGIVDFDEVVYSRISYKHNLKGMLKWLDRRFPDASGFSFMTEIFITNWYDRLNVTTPSNSSSSMWHSRYQNRTGPMPDRTKNIINMERVVPDSVWTHNYTSLPGFKNYKISSSIGCLKHYRACRDQWVEEGKCFRLRKYRDSTIANILENINTTVLEKKRTFLGF